MTLSLMVPKVEASDDLKEDMNVKKNYHNQAKEKCKIKVNRI